MIVVRDKKVVKINVNQKAEVVLMVVLMVVMDGMVEVMVEGVMAAVVMPAMAVEIPSGGGTTPRGVSPRDSPLTMGGWGVAVPLRAGVCTEA